MTSDLSQLVPIETVLKRIFVLRGQKVMIDSDLAELYGVTTKRLNEQVKRNITRFPSDFMFRLTHGELESLNRSQFATGSKHRDPNFYPYAFTEHGVAMLSSVLNSKQAVQMNILIIRAFIKIREVLATHKDLAFKFEKLEKGQLKHSKQIETIQEILLRLISKPLEPQLVKNPIGFQP